MKKITPCLLLLLSTHLLAQGTPMGVIRYENETVCSKRGKNNTPVRSWGPDRANCEKSGGQVIVRKKKVFVQDI